MGISWHEFNRIIDEYDTQEIVSMPEMKQYTVDNAIILAAGECKRCRPLSYHCPKGLFKVKGEILIERQIRQLIETGIDDIYVVTGYKADMFNYLESKYNVHLVYNPEFETTNNISSVYYARKFLRNSYILGSDNWYEKNIFSKFNYDSYYSCLYNEGHSDEYCIDVKEGYITNIKKGGNDCLYTLGDIYFSNKLSKKIQIILEENYDLDKMLIIDLFCEKYIDRLEFMALKREGGSIYEFDTIDEILDFDEKFMDFYNSHLKGDLL